MGAEFATLVQKVYAEKHHGVSKGFGVIKANPDKSKHLETATICIEDHWIDFVNLRKEEYAHDSRIPTMMFGTPLEDAERRDLTINSLFYNINEGKVEDFTKKGIEDLKNGYIRTPLDPLQTFMDDPLRILRVFRFAARYEFKIDPAISEAVHNQTVLEHLEHKVSRERIGKEVEPALENINAVLYLNMIYHHGILLVVFDIEEKTLDPFSPSFIMDQFKMNHGVWNRVLEMSQKYNGILFKANLEHPQVTRCYLMLSALLWGFHTKRFNKSMLFVEHFIKECLKLKNKTSDDVKSILLGTQQLIGILDNDPDMKDWSIAEKLAIFVREQGNLYPLCFILLFSIPGAEPHKQSLYELLKTHNLVNFHEAKPLLSGNDAMSIFKITGKDIKPFLDKAIRWQAAHVDAKKEDIVAHFKKEFGIKDDTSN